MQPQVPPPGVEPSVTPGGHTVDVGLVGCSCAGTCSSCPGCRGGRGLTPTPGYVHLNLALSSAVTSSRLATEPGTESPDSVHKPLGWL